MTAVPNEGFTFRQWSDGVIQNPRTDVDVAAEVSVAQEIPGVVPPDVRGGFPNGTVTGRTVTSRFARVVRAVQSRPCREKALDSSIGVMTESTMPGQTRTARPLM